MGRILLIGMALAAGASLLPATARADAFADLDACAASAQNDDWHQAQYYCNAAIDSGELDSASLAAAFGIRCLADKERGETDRAIDACQRALEINPQDKVAYFHLGVIAQQRGDLDGAIAAYDAALAIDPGHVDSSINRGLAYSDRGEYDRAIADLDRVISLDPFNATAYFNRGITYIQKGESARAIQDFDSAITLNPNSANYYVNRSIAMFNTGNLAGALEDCDTALRLDPNNAEAYGRRGDVRFETGDYALAIQDYDQSLLIDPGPVAFYAYRGQAHFILGNFAAASGDFAVMVERDPTDGYAVLLRSIAGRRGGEDVVRIFEADAARVDLATWPGPIVKYFLGDLSMEDLRQVAETTPADGIDKICEYDLYVGLGALLFKDNHAAARPLFEQAELDCQPNSMADRFAKAELARMPQ